VFLAFEKYATFLEIFFGAGVHCAGE